MSQLNYIIYYFYVFILIGMKNLKIRLIVLNLFFSTVGFCAFGNTKSYPPEVEKVLVKAGKNRVELEKFLDFASKSSDNLYLKAAIYLVANMDAHYSENFKWLTPDNQPYAFNELSFPDFDQAQAARDKLLSDKKMKAEYYITNDAETANADILKDHLKRAFQQWKQPWAKHLSFSQFCETLLPYRCMTEKLENWYPSFEKEFGFMKDNKNKMDVLQASAALNEYIYSHFICSVTFENRVEQISFLSPQQLLFRKQGPCQDNVNYIVLAMKSQGLPCYIDFVPYHATSTGRHYWNVTTTEEGKLFPFETDKNKFQRFTFKHEPGKIFRVCYAVQPGNLTDSYPNEPVPNNHLRFKNLKDVTADYWKVTDMFWEKPTGIKSKVAFIAVFNGLNWRCTDWCSAESEMLHFKNMSTGVAYLPVEFNGQRNIALGYPQTVDSMGIKTLLKPDSTKPIKIIMREQERYLIFRPGKKYTLYYWDYRWIKTAEKIADDKPELVFENVPSNALYLMVPEYSKGKERPFSIDKDGMRVWW